MAWIMSLLFDISSLGSSRFCTGCQDSRAQMRISFKSQVHSEQHLHMELHWLSRTPHLVSYPIPTIWSLLPLSFGYFHHLDPKQTQPMFTPLHPLDPSWIWPHYNYCLQTLYFVTGVLYDRFAEGWPLSHLSNFFQEVWMWRVQPKVGILVKVKRLKSQIDQSLQACWRLQF
jgi:hypothetical protein